MRVAPGRWLSRFAEHLAEISLPNTPEKRVVAANNAHDFVRRLRPRSVSNLKITIRLARSLLDVDRPSEAADVMKEGAKRAAAISGPQSLWTWRWEMWAAYFCALAGQFSDAVELARHARLISMNKLGRDHPKTVQVDRWVQEFEKGTVPPGLVYGGRHVRSPGPGAIWTIVE